jgi:hypothetical protein
MTSETSLIEYAQLKALEKTGVQAMIESYSFGRIVIDGQSYTSDVIVHPGGVKSQWVRRSSHSLVPEDLEGLMEGPGRTIIVGTGKVGRMKVPEQTRHYLRSRGFEVVIERTDQACETYNRLSQASPVIAALHLSC